VETDAVLAADPRNRFALQVRGESLRDLRDFDGALAAVEQVLTQDANDLEAIFLKVTVAEARRDFTTAASELEKVLARERRQEDAAESGRNDRLFLVHLAIAYGQLGRHQEAAATFEKARNVGGEVDPGLVVQHVEALVQAKDLPRALSEARTGRTKFPDDSELAVLEAGVLREQGQLPQALVIIEGLRKKSPEDVDVLVDVADFYRRAKKLPDAESVLRQARAADPKDLRTLFQLGAVLERQKRQDDAEAVFREALAVQPDSAPVLNYLGYMNADRGVRVPEALSLIEKAVQLDPENGAYLDSLGWALFRMDRAEEAEGYVRRAVAKDGKNAVVLDHMGDILRRRGNLREALDCWRRALEGEDDGEELDRAQVERKIREVQSSLNDGAPISRR
jgi:tetratricopeptide (TPR) repeat protein